MPGHVDIQGNKRSDEEAKKAAKGIMSKMKRLLRAIKGRLPSSRSVIRQAFNKDLKKR